MVIFIYLVFLAEKEHIGVDMHVHLHTHTEVQNHALWSSGILEKHTLLSLF